ncbi:MAG TPA: PIN domain-containing protein [Planctomycetaceae bacterium]|nr:PIN domain-containing protein [Planctomycetaceae bacterium]
MRGAAFLDSGIFIAALNQRDQWHEQAAALFAQARPRWCTSLLVISEAYSWFLHRMGEEAARTFRLFVATLEGLRIFEATLSHHEAVGGILDRFRGSRLTYVDASSLCFLERHKIRRVWATDHHLGLSGAEVLPRS